jgi:hypothetical protein
MIVGMVLFGLLVGTVANALTRASGNAAQLYRYVCPEPFAAGCVPKTAL